MDRLGSSLDDTIKAPGYATLTLRNLVILMCQMVSIATFVMLMQVPDEFYHGSWTSLNMSTIRVSFTATSSLATSCSDPSRKGKAGDSTLSTSDSPDRG